ncbi:hypothetical protein PV336_04585 [Streptomyces sp. MI02-2A]|nr:MULTISPECIES: hypothetical protein [unclassified Streptomyces]MDX3258513.1 hypothetical protein [Streptomyces sp. MI02-2A]REE58080.1 hypothetical protein BX257_0482 [Streptomyces sp. 3212.3]
MDNTAATVGGVGTKLQFRAFADSSIRASRRTNCSGSPVTVDFCTG